MALRLVGQTSGYVEIHAHSTASDNALTLPVDNGTNGQVLTTDGSGGLSFTTITAPSAGVSLGLAIALG
jgi:hypothetical protein